MTADTPATRLDDAALDVLEDVLCDCALQWAGNGPSGLIVSAKDAIRSLRARVGELEAEVNAQEERANENKARAERAEAQLAESRADAERLAVEVAGLKDTVSRAITDARRDAMKEAFGRTIAARKAHVDAVNAYNTKREIKYGNEDWTVNLDPEFQAMGDALRAFIGAAMNAADAILAAQEQP